MENEIVFWKNNGHPCVDHQCTQDAVQIIGLFTGDEDFAKIRWLGEIQEIAHDYDFYGEETEEYSTGQETADMIRERMNQTPNYSVQSVYPGIELSFPEDALKTLQITAENQRTPNTKIFVPVATPHQHGISFVFLLNHGFQGILHSFVRHKNDWSKIDPVIERFRDNLRPVETELNAVGAWSTAKLAREATWGFLNRLEGLDQEDFNGVQRTLNSIQISLVKTLQAKMTYQNYRGEGLNNSNQLQMYFSVGDDLVAVLGISRELFLAEPKLDHRPFRTIITMYFISESECTSRTAVKTY